MLSEVACGAGKTLSVVAPAMVIGAEKRKKVVIATPVRQRMVQFVEEALEVREAARNAVKQKNTL